VPVELVLVLSATALLVGFLVGSVGVGGVLLPPALAYIVGMDIHLAMATSMFSFLFTGAVGTAMYSRKGSVDWRLVGWLTIGLTPAALLGARTNTLLSAGMLKLVLALVVTGAGIHALLKSHRRHEDARVLGVPTLVCVGFGVGFGSALSGTGGPILLVPLLLALSLPPLGAIAASQVVQLPIAFSATVGYLLYGHVDVVLGLLCGLVATLGVALGASVAHWVPAIVLRRTVASALVIAGTMIAVDAFTNRMT
jgi:uncharacterized membrane protein YfcA